jgi:hypothetical protein
MSKNITPYKDSALGKKEQVAKCLMRFLEITII